MRYLILSLLLIGCCESKSTPESKKRITHIKAKYEMTCVHIDNMRRCENVEVICYSTRGYDRQPALQCKFKK